jgi:hypothetical protein
MHVGIANRRAGGSVSSLLSPKDEAHWSLAASTSSRIDTALLLAQMEDQRPRAYYPCSC